MKKVKEIMGVVFKNFINSDIMMLSNDLTYVSLISIFPFLAIILGFSKGFGLDIILLNKINSLIPASEKQLNFILEITRNLLNSLSTSLLAGLGIILVFWTATGLLQKIEISFNKIWHTHPKNGILKNFTNYLAIIILVPIFLVIFIATNDKVTSLALKMQYLSSYSIFLFSLIRIALLVLFLTLIYQKVPNTNVSLKSSFIAASIVTFILYVLSYFYGIIFSSISKYNAIYGSLAFIPLFLLWIKYLWVILLTGAQITYSIDINFEVGDSEISLKYKKSISVYIMYKLIKRFLNNEENYNLKELSNEIGIKNYVVRMCLDILEDMDYVICKGKEENVIIQINKNPNDLSIWTFVKDYENQGDNNIHIFKEEIDNADIFKVDSLLNPCENKLIKELMD